MSLLLLGVFLLLVLGPVTETLPEAVLAGALPVEVAAFAEVVAFVWAALTLVELSGALEQHCLELEQASLFGAWRQERLLLGEAFSSQPCGPWTRRGL